MDLKLSGYNIDSVFALNGYDENSATYAFGWVLSKSRALLQTTISDFFQLHFNPKQTHIDLQKYGTTDKGFTDIEIRCPNVCHIIVEAKRDWTLPSNEQLEKYSGRFSADPTPNPLIVSLSAASQEYAECYLPQTINNIPLVHRSWADLRLLVREAYKRTNSYVEKLWLYELEIHLKGYVSMRNPKDNEAFVVVLSHKPTRQDGDYTFIDVVEKDGRYFHPIGHPFPAIPPNYMAFRYDGELRSVHHVDSYEVVTNLSSYNKNWMETDNDHFVYKLGPAMKPPITIKNGGIYNTGRLWCAIDTLLSGAYATIKDARDETKSRKEVLGE